MAKKTHKVVVKDKETHEIMHELKPVTELQADWSLMTANVMIDKSKFYAEIVEV